MKKTLLPLALVLTVGLAGCSVYKAAKLPPKRDLSRMQTGIKKAYLIAEFGPPVSEVQNPDGTSTAIFTFEDGYSRGARLGRTAMHASFDVLTLGLWEVVGMPIESMFDGKTKSFEVTFDANGRASEITPLVVRD